MHFLARSSQSSLDILSKWVWVHTRAHAANFWYITENSNFLDVICNTYVCLYVVNIADEKIYNLKPSSMPFQFYNWIHFKLSRWCNSCPSKKYHPLKKKESMHFSDRSSMCTYIYYYMYTAPVNSAQKLGWDVFWFSFQMICWLNLTQRVPIDLAT